MGDVFKEQLVKKSITSKDKFMKVGFFILAILVFFLSTILIPFFSFFILVLGIFVAWYFSSQLNQEFEYVFTNGEFDIDCIYNRNKRKRKVSFETSSIEYMTYSTNESATHTFNSAVQVMDFSSGTTDDTYSIIIPIEGKKTRIIFEPNDKILECFDKSLNRLTFVRK